MRRTTARAIGGEWRSLRPLRGERVLRAWPGLIALAVVLSLVPASALPSEVPGAAVAHGLAYAVLALIPLIGIPEWRSASLRALLMAPLGLALEV
jgi:hypothetical protein